MTSGGVSRRWRIAGQLQLMLLPMLFLLLAASPARMSLEDEDDGKESGWQLVRSLAQRFKTEELDDLGGSEPARKCPKGATADCPTASDELTTVQLEATKRSWISELQEKAEDTGEAADLIDEIRSRTSGSGLKSLKAACNAMCPKCVCGVILMPSMPGVASHGTAPIAKPKKAEKRPKKKPKKAEKKPKKAEKKPKKAEKKPKKAEKKPEKKPEKAEKKPEKAEKKPEKAEKKPEKAEKKPEKPPAKEAEKKAKKSLLVDNLESQLPDFLLDEGGSAYKREVDDHDPLSLTREELSNFGVE